MSTNAVWGIGLCAATLLVASRGLAADERGRAAEQPELKPALEQAPKLQPESLGEPARAVNVWERWLVPNPDGKTWDILKVGDTGRYLADQKSQPILVVGDTPWSLVAQPQDQDLARYLKIASTGASTRSS